MARVTKDHGVVPPDVPGVEGVLLGDPEDVHKVGLYQVAIGFILGGLEKMLPV